VGHVTYNRTDRLSEEIKKEVSHIIHNELKDPRISGMCSVMNVLVTRDLRYAKIYVSVLGNEKEQESTLEGLNRAIGFIRKELGKRIKIRYTPEISFVLDTSIEYSVHISKIIDEVNRQREEE